MKRLIYFFAVIISLAGANASGVAVTPDSISFKVLEGEIKEKQIIIYNLDDEAAAFTIKHDRTYINVDPQKGMMPAHSSQMILLTNNPELKQGTYTTEISPQLHHPTMNLVVGAIVKANIAIDKKIVYAKFDPTGPIISVLIIITGLIIFYSLR